MPAIDDQGYCPLRALRGFARDPGSREGAKTRNRGIIEHLRRQDRRPGARGRLHDELFRAMLEELMTGRLRAGALAETA
jgi:hypothetical protein